LPTNTEKMLRVPSKNAIVTSLPVTQGTQGHPKVRLPKVPHFLSIYAQCIFSQSQVESRQSNFLFKSYLKKPAGRAYM